MRFNIFKKKKRTLTEEELQFIKDSSEKARRAADEKYAEEHSQLMNEANQLIGSGKQLDKLYPVQSPLTSLMHLVANESQRHIIISLPCIDEKTGEKVQKNVVDPHCYDAEHFPQMYHIFKLRPVNSSAPAFPSELYGVIGRADKIVEEYCRICETEGANHPYKITPPEIILPLIKENTPKDGFSQTVCKWFLGEMDHEMFLAYLNEKSKEQEKMPSIRLQDEDLLK